MNSQADEDAIDLQDLQAQIDLSMSFAQNLITSWVKPTHYSQSSRQKDLENGIKEYMRRPARLGVGAPIPETQSLAREAARLKYKLDGGKKRQREDEGSGSKKHESDDEGESRSGAIKKKARADPFDIPSKKGKKKNTELNGKSGPTIHPAALKAISHDWAEMDDGFDVDAVARELLVDPESPGMLEKKTSQKAQDKLSCPEEQGTKQPKLPLSSRVKTVVDETPSKSPARSEPSKHLEPSPPAASLAAHPKLDISSPFLSNQPSAGVSLLQQPLLNLYGSPSEGEGDEDENPGPSGRTPKKRKRRKKKKSLQHINSTSAQV